MTLTAEEREAARQIGFAENVLERLKHATGATRLDVLSRAGETEANGITHAVTATLSRGASEDVLLGLRRDLLPWGYLPFLIDRTFDFQDRPDTIAVLKATDPLAPVRFAGTDAPNYGRSHADILRTLEGWLARFDYDVLGAEQDSLYLRFHTLPADKDAFAAEMAEFCPDLIDQGFRVAVEEAREYLSEEQREEIERLFAEDTGDAEGKAERVALRLLANSIDITRRLHLWWD